MTNESLKTLEHLERLVQKRNGEKKFIKIDAAEEKYGIERRSLYEVAQECGALYRKNNIVLIDDSVFEPYFVEKFKVEEDV